MPSFATTAGGIYEVGGGIDAVISITFRGLWPEWCSRLNSVGGLPLEDGSKVAAGSSVS